MIAVGRLHFILLGKGMRTHFIGNVTLSKFSEEHDSTSTDRLEEMAVET